jgi:hypothetical protein
MTQLNPNDLDALERRIDALVRPTLVLDPPPRLQADLLASVLRAADTLYAAPPVQAAAAVARPAGHAVSPLVYAVVAALVGAYLTVVGALGGALTDWSWLPVLVEQVRAAVALATGPSAGDTALRLLGAVFEQAPWLVLTPLLFLLWERDRAALQGR